MSPKALVLNSGGNIWSLIQNILRLKESMKMKGSGLWSRGGASIRILCTALCVGDCVCLSRGGVALKRYLLLTYCCILCMQLCLLSVLHSSDLSLCLLFVFYMFCTCFYLCLRVSSSNVDVCKCMTLFVGDSVLSISVYNVVCAVLFQSI